MIQTLWLDDIVVNDLDLKATFRGRWQILDELPQLWSTNSICTIDSDWPIELSSPCRSLEGRSYLLVIAFFGWFTILIWCIFRIQTTGDVMELRCGQISVVGVLRIRCLKSCQKRRDKPRSRSPGVSSKDNPCFYLRLNVQIACKLIVDFQESLIGGCVCKCCSICFPSTLDPFSERPTALECCRWWLYL